MLGITISGGTVARSTGIPTNVVLLSGPTSLTGNLNFPWLFGTLEVIKFHLKTRRHNDWLNPWHLSNLFNLRKTTTHQINCEKQPAKFGYIYIYIYVDENKCWNDLKCLSHQLLGHISAEVYRIYVENPSIYLRCFGKLTQNLPIA